MLKPSSELCLITDSRSRLPGLPLREAESSLVFSGLFLDTRSHFRKLKIPQASNIVFRSSAVFGAGFFIGSLIFAIYLGSAPQLAFALFFGLTLLVAVFSVNPCTYISISGEHEIKYRTFAVLAYPSYSPASSFVIAIGFYAAISIATLIFIFPQSFSHIWL